mgnify:FL=1
MSMETILSRWTQPTGGDIRIGWGHMDDGVGYWCVRRHNYQQIELWNGWPLDTIQRVMGRWDDFEARIGSTPNPRHYDSR